MGAGSCSHLPPPSLPHSSSSFLLQPVPFCITSRGDREERSEACSSHSVSHLVNCFPSSSLPYCTDQRIVFTTLCETHFYREKSLFAVFENTQNPDSFEKEIPVFSNLLIICVWYSDPVLIPLWLLLFVSTGVVKIGLLLCLCCHFFFFLRGGKGPLYEIWLFVELKRGRNLRRWFDLEERAIFSCGLASSLLQRRERSSVLKTKKGVSPRCFICGFYIPSLDKPGKVIHFAKREEVFASLQF